MYLWACGQVGHNMVTLAETVSHSKDCLNSPLCCPQLSPFLYCAVNGLSIILPLNDFSWWSAWVFNTCIRTKTKQCCLGNHVDIEGKVRPWSLRLHSSLVPTVLQKPCWWCGFYVMVEMHMPMSLYRMTNSSFHGVLSTLKSMAQKTWVNMSMTFHLHELHFPCVKFGRQVRYFVL